MIRCVKYNTTSTPGRVQTIRDGSCIRRTMAGHCLLPRGFFGVIGALLIWSALCASASGQVTGGAVSGTVTDPTKSAVPGATVAILNVAKGETRTVVTNGQGYFNTPNLLPGRYDVIVSASGFGYSQ